MLDPRFVILGAVLNLIGSASYAADILKGRNRPNRVTWLLWALAPLILWALTRTGNIAILFSILADSLAFLLSAFAGAITLLTLRAWTFAEVAFPAYIVIVCAALYVLIQFPNFRYAKKAVS